MLLPPAAAKGWTTSPSSRGQDAALSRRKPRVRFPVGTPAFPPLSAVSTVAVPNPSLNCGIASARHAISRADAPVALALDRLVSFPRRGSPMSATAQASNSSPPATASLTPRCGAGCSRWASSPAAPPSRAAASPGRRRGARPPGEPRPAAAGDRLQDACRAAMAGLDGAGARGDPHVLAAGRFTVASRGRSGLPERQPFAADPSVAFYVALRSRPRRDAGEGGVAALAHRRPGKAPGPAPQSLISSLRSF